MGMGWESSEGLREQQGCGGVCAKLSWGPGCRDSCLNDHFCLLCDLFFPPKRDDGKG